MFRHKQLRSRTHCNLKTLQTRKSHVFSFKVVVKCQSQRTVTWNNFIGPREIFPFKYAVPLLTVNTKTLLAENSFAQVEYSYRETQLMDMNVTSHTQCFCPIMFFLLILYILVRKVNVVLRKMKGGTYRKLMPGEQRGHTDIGQWNT